MQYSEYSATNILEILDNGAKIFDFPMLDNNYYYFGKAIMRIFRNDSEWLMIFQELSFAIRDGRFINKTVAFGNMIDGHCLKFIRKIIYEAQDDKMFDNDGHFLLNPLHFKILIQEIEREFNPHETDYRKLGIDINDAKTPNEAKILRFLVATIPDELFLSSAGLLEICKRSDTNLTVFMELEDWNHPDLIDDELPSDNDCFRSLANALEKNNPDLYQCPPEACNTHWSNWEWYKADWGN